MSELRFAQPQWLHAFWGVLAFVALLFWLELRGVGALDQLIGNALQRRLVRRPSSRSGVGCGSPCWDCRPLVWCSR